MRKLVYDFLVGLEPATGIGSGSIFERSSLVDGRPATPPFLIYTLTTEAADVRMPATSTMEIWVYDELGSYVRVDSILRAIRSAFVDMAVLARTRTDGSVVRLIQADWLGTSADLNDDVFRCATRNATWRLVGSGQ